MKLKSFTKNIFAAVAMLAASMSSANAADRLLIVGDAVWGGYSIDNSIVMFNTEDAPDVYKATVYLDASKEFKFLTETYWGGFEYRAGESSVTLQEGVESKLVSTDETDKDEKFFVTESANYDITCDLVQQTIVIAKSAYQEQPIHHTGIWMIGNATPGGWSISDGLLLQQDAADPFQFAGTVTLQAGEFKFAINNQTGFGQTFYQRDMENEGKIKFGGDDNKWIVSEENTYDVVLNLSSLTISFTMHNPTAIAPVSSASVTGQQAEYFTLGGVKVSRTSPGNIYIKRQGNEIHKIIAR